MAGSLRQPLSAAGVVVLSVCFLCTALAIEILPYDPVASSGAVVVAPGGSARFTVLTPRLIRMEYSHAGVFEDRATIAGARAARRRCVRRSAAMRACVRACMRVQS